VTAPLSAPAVRRWGPVALIGALVASLVVFATTYQAIETVVTGWLIGVVSRVPVMTIGASRLIVVNGDSAEGFGLTITNSCSSLPILVAFAIVSLGLLLTGKVPTRRIGRSLSTALVLSIGINLVRLAIVGWFTVRWGTSSGFSWSHTYVGSVLTVVGIGAGTVTYGYVLVKRGKHGTPTS
jgi:exosortase/archaeosortase family protein